MQMTAEFGVLAAVSCLTVLASLGVLLTKDNFYAALYMALTMIFVASCYGLFGLHPAFVLIAFVFVGAIGIVTVALAATYRKPPERQISPLWIAPSVITAAILGYSAFLWHTHSPNLSEIGLKMRDFLAPENILLVIFLISLVVLLVSAILRIYGREA